VIPSFRRGGTPEVAGQQEPCCSTGAQQDIPAQKLFH
jgi:hypothetical protein